MNPGNSKYRGCAGLAMALLAAASLAAEDITVSPTGPVASIADAVARARAGDRILVYPGIYRESPIRITTSLSLIGIDNPVLDGEGKHEIVYVQADSVVISGFILRDVGVSFVDDNAAIKAVTSNGCRFENNRIENGFFGIYLAQCRETIVRNNVFVASGLRETTSGNGIHLWNSNDVLITDNDISGHRDGIYLEFVEDGEIHRNRSHHNLRYGLHFMFSHRSSYTENVFASNGAGVAVMYTRKVHMQGNRFEKNWGSASYGLLLKDIVDSQVTGNYFYKNSIGLYAEASNRIRVVNNHFERNGWAVKIMANSMDNIFQDNNFIDNTFEVATNSRQNFNSFQKNYWSSYSGYDLDHDGTGDVPFRPVRLFSMLVEKQPTSLLLLRSLFIAMLDIAERMLPVLTPETLIDASPRMRALPLTSGIFADPLAELQNDL